MKNLVKSVLVVATVGMFVTSASAINGIAVQDVMVQDTVVKKDTVKKDVPETLMLAQNEVTYTKIETAEVPETLKSAVSTKYAAYSIEEAYKGSDNGYKLVLKNGDAKLTVYYNEAGEFVKEESCEAPQTVVLV